MAEAKNSFIRSKMNKDLDERLIPSNEYRDALNIAVSRSEASDVGALESVPGNILVANANSGEEIIGYYVNETNDVAYVFKTDWKESGKAPSTANCSIEVFNSAGNTIQVLVSGSWLNFSTSSRMNGVSIIENLLYFSDNRNQPRKINVDIAFNSSSYYFNEDQISVAKYAPNTPPGFINLRSNVSNPFLPNSTNRPSTMSDAADPDTIQIGIYNISNSNLAVKKYRNGDSIIDGNDPTDWNNADTNQQGAWCYYEEDPGNGVTYGLLYNKWAVVDSRGLAPTGFTIPTSSEWTSIVGSAEGSPLTEGKNMKSIDFWATPGGLNSQGFNGRPAGFRNPGGNAPFSGLLTRTTYWDSEPESTGANSGVALTNGSDMVVSQTALSSGQGYSVRVIKQAGYNGWNGDPDFLTDKFARFSYRFKFDDNEYSVVAPWSQDVFIPKQDGYFLNNDENEAFVSTVVQFMENSINNAVLNIELPCIDIINNYKIKAIDILFKESDDIAYKVLETVKVDNNFIQSLNYTNIFQYSYQSKQPIKTLPESETTRVFDKVPVKALAQETAGNRVLYANMQEGHSAPDGLNYFVDVQQKLFQSYTEYPQHSLKQNRNYQIGFVLADKYGRQTDIILSTRDGLLDSSGNPQPGSNVFNDYKPTSFTPSVDGWLGDNAVINIESQIPEEENANGLSGYPGAYAIGNYFQVDPAGNPGPYFLSDSCNYFSVANGTGTGWPLNQGDIIFGTYLQYSDATDSNNVLNVYVNETGNGWILKELTTDYTITTNGPFLRVTFNNALDPGLNVKVEILFGLNRLYRYRAGGSVATAPAADPLFDDFANTYTNYFAVGKHWKGQYIDYTETVSLTPVDVQSPGVPYGVIFETKEEISIDYLFNSTPVSQNPGGLLVATTFASYNINPLGFYTYRLGIKQQQQDYYNVYLPGILNGYPLGETPTELNEVAFTTLVSDNINKVPRNLQDVGPLENQFTSDVTWFPRVENIAPFITAPTTNQLILNKQVDPLSSADKVELIGTIDDAFPDVTEWNNTTIPIPLGELNTNAIYNYDQRPYIAKISTRKGVGIDVDDYDPPSSGSGNYPYSANMGLAVYETSPTISQLELFYETSTSGLISTINSDIINDSQEITGLTSFTVSFPESSLSGTQITNAFFPVSNGSILTNTTAQFASIYRYDNQGNLDTSIDFSAGTSPSFVLNNAGASGYSIDIATTFYAGQFGSQSVEPDYRLDTKGKYVATIAFTQSNGVISNQTIELPLANTNPQVVGFPTAPINLTTTGSNTVVQTSSGSPTVQSPGGRNGSARAYNPPSVTNGHYLSFYNTISGFTGPYGWIIDEINKIAADGSISTFGPQGNSNYDHEIRDLVKIPFQGINTTGTQGDQWRFVLNMENYQGQPTNTSGGVGGPGAYEAFMRLTDTNFSSTPTGTSPGSVRLTWNVGAYTDNRFIYNTYSDNGSGTQPADWIVQAPPFKNPQNAVGGFSSWHAQFLNYSSSNVWVYARIVSFNGAPAASTVSANVFNSLYSDGTNAGTGGTQLMQVSVPGSQVAQYSIWALVAYVDGVTFSQNEKAAEVGPGQQNQTAGTQTYDYVTSAAFNSKIQFVSQTMNNTHFQVELWQSDQQLPANTPGSVVPSSFTQIGSQTKITQSPPMFGNTPTPGSRGTSSDFDVYPTTLVSPDGFVGPVVN